MVADPVVSGRTAFDDTLTVSSKFFLPNIIVMNMLIGGAQQVSLRPPRLQDEFFISVWSE